MNLRVPNSEINDKFTENEHINKISYQYKSIEYLDGDSLWGETSNRS